jgi:hypothetical protein
MIYEMYVFVYIKMPLCIECKIKLSSFGLPTDKKPQYCRDCKKEGMIDLKNSKCIECKRKQPNFGLLANKKAQYCGDCKKEGMINLRSSKCIECKIKQSSFGQPTDKKIQYCGDCKKEGMINLNIQIKMMNKKRISTTCEYDDYSNASISKTKRTKIDIWELL